MSQGHGSVVLWDPKPPSGLVCREDRQTWCPGPHGTRGLSPREASGGPHDILAWGGSLREQRPNAPCLASDSCPSYLEAPLPSEPQGPLPRLLLQLLELPPLCLWVTEA